MSAAGEMRGDMEVPRACRAKGRLRDGVRDDYMLIEVEPPVIGQNYGLGDEDIRELVIATRHKGESLYQITKWPCPVYVARILDPCVVDSLTFTDDQVKMIAWALLFRTAEDVNAWVLKSSREAD